MTIEIQRLHRLEISAFPTLELGRPMLYAKKNGDEKEVFLLIGLPQGLEVGITSSVNLTTKDLEVDTDEHAIDTLKIYLIKKSGLAMGLELLKLTGFNASSKGILRVNIFFNQGSQFVGKTTIVLDDADDGVPIIPSS